MIFGKKNHLVGLDIGSKTIKAGEIDVTAKGFTLKKFGLLDIPEGAMVDGLIKKTDEITASIRELFDRADIREKNVAISIGGNKVIVKTIDVQQMSEQQFGEIMQFEAEQYIPFDIDDVNLDFHILGESAQNPDHMQVLLVAVKKDMILEYVELVESAGLNPCIIDIDTFALQNIYELAYDGQNHHIALIDIGASKTSLNVLQKGGTLFMRDISSGCGQINAKIMSQTGCTPEDAESMKRDKKVPENVRSIITSIVAGWCSEIGHALDIYYSTYTDDRIEKIYLSGGGAHIQVLHQLLARQTDTQVQNLDPFRRIRFADRGLDIEYLRSLAPQVAICMGLGIRRVDDK